MLIIPIGIQCTSAKFKHEINSSESLPFDWMFATPKFVYEMLNLLLVQNMDIEELVNEHFFFCEKKAGLSSKLEYYYTCENGFAPFNAKYGAIFPHDHGDKKDTVDKYVRRFIRLKDILLHSPEELCLLYVSPSSTDIGNFAIDGRLVVQDTYFYLTKIYEMIGTVRKDKYQMYCFDTFHSDSTRPLSLHKDIRFIKLNPCNHWEKVYEQMQNYIHLFA